MADFSVTIANRLNVFGPAPSNKWNAWAWNAFVWGEGTAGLPVAVVKVIGNAVTPTDETTAEAAFVIAIANTLTPVADMGSERLADAAGYDYVYADRVTNAESRALPTWAAASGATSGWTSVAAASTVWS